jgi:hypothetical protein
MYIRKGQPRSRLRQDANAREVPEFGSRELEHLPDAAGENRFRDREREAFHLFAGDVWGHREGVRVGPRPGAAAAGDHLSVGSASGPGRPLTGCTRGDAARIREDE